MKFDDCGVLLLGSRVPEGAKIQTSSGASFLDSVRLVCDVQLCVGGLMDNLRVENLEFDASNLTRELQRFEV